MPARRSSLVLVALAAILASMFAAPARGVDDTSAAKTSTSRAQDALDTVRAIFTGADSGSRSFGQSGAPADSGEPARGEATMALRDLALLKDELTGADRQQAESFLARPEPPVKTCGGAVCVHYRRTGAHAATPAYASTVLNTVLHVHNTYVAAGYRAPKGDGPLGGGNQTDIYLQDIGDDGLYGYCTTDQNFPPNGPFDVWAYCVLDNDYSSQEFPTNTPIENLQVTAAHEYFHAVQFGYDFAEDRWFMEATAVWVEDEMYDNVDDNLQYLRQSPLRLPWVPMDTFGGSFHYGTWIFFRYLSERYPSSVGGLPTIVRDMWRKADGAAGKRDLVSIKAVSSVLKARRTSFPKLFAKFSNANRRPAQIYSEGRANKYKSAPLAKRYRLGRGQLRGGSVRLNHLTSATVRFTPAKALKAKTTKLRVSLKMAPSAKGSAAVASVKLKSGKVRVIAIRIKGSGSGVKALPFSSKVVKYVELTLANGGTQYRCFRGGPYSCQGYSKNDRALESFRAAVLSRRA